MNDFNTVLANVQRLAKEQGIDFQPGTIQQPNVSRKMPLFDPVEVRMLKDVYFQRYYKNGKPMKPLLVFKKNEVGTISSRSDGSIMIIDGMQQIKYDVKEGVDFDFI